MIRRRSVRPQIEEIRKRKQEVRRKWYGRMRQQIAAQVDNPFGGCAGSGFDLDDELKLSVRTVYRNIGVSHRVSSNV